MKLVYIWINESMNKDIYGTPILGKLDLNFSNAINVKYVESENKLHIDINNESELKNFYSTDENISCVKQINCIVGSNGVGKTTLLRHILDTECLPESSEYPSWKTIQIYENKEDNFSILTNINDLKFVCSDQNNIFKIVSPFEKANDEYSKMSKIFLSNDQYAAINGSYFSTAAEKVAFTPYDLNVLKTNFYELCGNKQQSIYNNTFSYRYNEQLVKNKRSYQLQSIFDLMLLKRVMATGKADKFDYFKNFKIRAAGRLEVIGTDLPRVQFRLNDIWDKQRNDIILKGEKALRIIEKDNNVSFDILGYDSIRLYFIFEKMKEARSFDEEKTNIPDTLRFWLAFEICLVLLEIPDECNNSIDKVVEKIVGSDIQSLLNYLEAYIVNSNSNQIYDYEKEKYSIRKKEEYDYFVLAKDSINQLEKIITKHLDKNTAIFEARHSVSLLDFINEQIVLKKSFVLKHFLVDGLAFSSGERAFLNIYSWLNASVYLNKLFPSLNRISLHENILLLIDEPDLYCHPKWQKKMIKELIDMCTILFEEKNVQLIYSTHSPITLSDVRGGDTVVLKKCENKIEIVNGKAKTESFAANIYDLYKNDYILDDFIGDFAKAKIDEAIKSIYNVYIKIRNRFVFKNGNELISEKENIKYLSAKKIVEIIGEPILKNKLLEMINYIDRNIEEEAL